jgi:chromosome segregation ATPase
MSEFARVTSLDALRDFKAALGDFAEQAGLALSEAQSDVQRTISWLSNDRLMHWQRELKKRNEKLALAKSELFRKQLESNDTRTSAVVERKNVAKIERLVEEAEEKLKNCKKWKTALERELMLFRAHCGQVASVVAADIPITMGRMDKMMDALQRYMSLAAPSGETPRAPGELAIENVFAEPLPSEKPEQSRPQKSAEAGDDS